MEKKEITLRELLDSEQYAKQRAIIQAEINENQVVIDYATFEQDDQERGRTITAKMQWREYIKKQGFSKRNFKQKIYFKS